METFTEKQLIEFGNYLLSEKRKKSFEATKRELERLGMNPLPVKDRIKQVTHADLENWKAKQSEQ